MLFVDVAHAMMGGAGGAGGEGGGASGLMSFLPFIAIFVIFYFMLIRPQQKRQKEHKQMLANLRKGDKVLTGGGMYGTIVDMDGDVLTVELADKLQVQVNRGYVSGLANPKADKKD